jgi:hypothetical protein
MKKLLAAILFAAFAAGPASGAAPLAQMKVSDLQRLCASPQEADHGACTFYIWGVMEGAHLIATRAGDRGHFCLPAGTSALDAGAVIKGRMVEDLAHYPADRDLPAVSFVTAVMTVVYPCDGPQ